MEHICLECGKEWFDNTYRYLSCPYCGVEGKVQSVSGGDESSDDELSDSEESLDDDDIPEDTEEDKD